MESLRSNTPPLPWVVVALLAFAGCGMQSHPNLPDMASPDLGLIDLSSVDTHPPDHDAGASQLPDVEWYPCNTDQWPAGYALPSEEVQCAIIEVPFDHADPLSSKFPLSVARERSKSSTGKALFYLAGGPGGTAVGLAGAVPSFYSGLLDTFDLIYVDLRGTWGSGALNCAVGFPRNLAEWIACANEHADKDLDHYLTLDGVHDLELIRKALGYEKIYLIGASYGTRLALEYVRQYEDNVAAIVLDGLAPPDFDMFGLNVTVVAKALDDLAKECGESTACLSVSPDLAGDLETRRLALKSQPRKILVNGVTYYEDDTTFSTFLYHCLDNAVLRYKIPRAIHEAVSGDPTLWDSLVSQAIGSVVRGASKLSPGSTSDPQRYRPRRPGLGLGGYDATGLMAAVSCAEWLPNSGGIDALETLRAAQIWFDDTFLDLARSCSHWKVSPLAAALRAPVHSTVKALVLSGAVDIHTPPETAEMVADTLPNSTSIVFPYAGHSTMTACNATIATAFLAADGEMKSVDTSCIQSLSQPPW